MRGRWLRKSPSQSPAGIHLSDAQGAAQSVYRLLATSRRVRWPCLGHHLDRLVHLDRPGEIHIHRYSSNRFKRHDDLILFTNNILDPVIPLSSAKHMSRFEGSDLVINDGKGHITLSIAGLYIAKAYSAYFQSGQLPHRSSPCLPNQRPFLGISGPRVGPVPANSSQEDKYPHQAILDLNRAFAGLL